MVSEGPCCPRNLPICNTNCIESTYIPTYNTYVLCTTLTPKIKGIPELTYHIYLCCLVSGIQ